MYGHNSIITYLSEKINQMFVDYLACLNVIKIETSQAWIEIHKGFATLSREYIYIHLTVLVN